MVQLSIDETQPPSFHHDIGKRLAPLREENILLLGSGNVVHNLHTYAWGRRVQEPYDRAISFETRVRELLLAEDYKPLIHYENQLGTEADLAVPTSEHYLPLLYVRRHTPGFGAFDFSCRRRGWRVGFNACCAGGINSVLLARARSGSESESSTGRAIAPQAGV